MIKKYFQHYWGKGRIPAKYVATVIQTTIPNCVSTIAGILLLLVMVITFIDVIGRYVFSSPIKGAVELTELIQTIFIVAGIWIVTIANHHITVDLFDRFLPRLFQHWWQNINWLLIIISFYFIGKRIWYFAARSARREEVSEYFLIPLFYGKAYVAIICYVTAGFALFYLLLAIFYPRETMQTEKIENQHD
ncbi:MAG: TRAP transporter small permease subunit [Alphaproteobacteria bacterium]|nr:TRAP transporter small permease subunit [Alphaproteobacteria bacterium]